MSLSSQVESSPRPELSFPSARTKGDSAPLINTFHQPLVNKYERLSAENRAAERLRALCLCPLMETPVFENGAEITLDERLVFKFLNLIVKSWFPKDLDFVLCSLMNQLLDQVYRRDKIFPEPGNRLENLPSVSNVFN